MEYENRALGTDPSEERVRELKEKIAGIISLIAGDLPVGISFDGYEKAEINPRGRIIVKPIMRVIFSDIFDPYTGKMTEHAGNIAQNARAVFEQMDTKEISLAKSYINTPQEKGSEVNSMDFDFTKLAPLEKRDFQKAELFIATNKKPISDYRERIGKKNIKIETDEKSGKKILVINRTPRSID